MFKIYIYIRVQFQIIRGVFVKSVTICIFGVVTL